MDECVTARKGDKIRVVLEGDVNFVSGGGIAVGHGEHENIIWPDAAHVVSVSVTPRGHKVGDVLDAVEAESSLPDRSVVLCLANDRPYIVIVNAFDGERRLNTDGTNMAATAGGPVRIVYLPAK